jgi:hypothetical protein
MKLYHGAPDPMIGHILVPLNQQKSAYPNLYKLHVAKYEGREEILQRPIPLLDCSWNDVLQFTPVHPQKVFKLQVELGLIPSVPPYKFFEVDSDLLDADKTVVFFKTAPGEENTSVEWLRDVDPSSLQSIPETTISYYKSLIGTGELPFNYQFVPHVTYMGNLDVSGLPVITLE